MAAVDEALEQRPGWFTVPAPVRELFKLFPLSTLPAEPLPERAPDSSTTRPRLYVFARTEEDALRGRPSFNPSCLKWQTFLRIAGVEVQLVPSNNHASPSGALPFLLPPLPSPGAKALPPIAGDKIRRYAKDHASAQLPDEPTSRMEAYEALLTQHIRPAWLYLLYLLPANLNLLTSLYLPPSTILQVSILRTLRTAATSEILKSTRRSIITPTQLLADAEVALSALSTLLSDKEWFFDSPSPGLFDAEVFAYTYLILDETLRWVDNPLAKSLSGFENLVAHKKRLYGRCWPEGGEPQ